MANPSSKSKTSVIDLAFLNGFSDEMEKISAVGVADVTKGIKNTTLTTKPKLVSKPPKVELETPATTLDPLKSTRTIQPPPVTAGGN